MCTQPFYTQSSHILPVLATILMLILFVSENVNLWLVVGLSYLPHLQLQRDLQEVEEEKVVCVKCNFILEISHFRNHHMLGC
jgi:hypothetical protein